MASRREDPTADQSARTSSPPPAGSDPDTTRPIATTDRTDEVRDAPPPAAVHDDGRDDLQVEGHTPKTSAAATFALVFGLSALICVLTVLLALPGLVLALVGLVLGAVGLSKTGKPWVTGKALAVSGLVLSGLALLLGVAVTVGTIALLNDQQAVDRLDEQLQDLRDGLPESVDGS